MNRPTHPIPPPPVFSREKVREVDRISIEGFGIPGIVLMENAARGVADLALRMLPVGGRALAVCGTGNNGGDGFAAARRLHNAGVQIAIVLIGDAQSVRGDARTNLDICRAMGLPLAQAGEEPHAVLERNSPCDLILDGIFGTGLSRAVADAAKAAIEWMNAQLAPVLAIDIPSGLDCDTGQPLGVAVRAAATATFVGMKRGFLSPGADRYTGPVHVVDIGAPREVVERLGEPR